jgi:SPP1 gp7 family putative phage head morphogenesis protein
MIEKSNKNYWEERFAAVANKAWSKTEKVNKELKKVYKSALKELQKDLAEWLAKYQALHDLDEVDMKKIMSKTEAAEFRNTVKWYIEQIQKLGIESEEGKKLLKELDVMGGRVKYQRYEELITSIRYQTLVISEELNKTTQLHLFDTVKDVYKRSLYELDQAETSGSFASFSFLDDEKIRKVIATPWSGKQFSKRIWDNRTELVGTLRNTVTNGIIQGHPFKKMSEKLQKDMEVGYYQARRIVETETSFAISVAKTQSYKDFGIEKYKFSAVLDNRTSKVCRDLDQEVFKVSEAKTGINLPPMHPFCRSTTYPAVLNEQETINADRFSRNPNGKKFEVYGNLNYEAWNKVYGIDLRDDIRNKYNLKVNKDSQGKHIEGSKTFKAGLNKSEITISIDEVQELVNKYAGTGKIEKANGKVRVETVASNKFVGIVKGNKIKGKGKRTRKFKIHYSKNGTHIVPFGGKVKNEFRKEIDRN